MDKKEFKRAIKEVTEEEGKSFTKVQYNNSDKDWVTCMVKDDIFSGAGDPQKLEKILTIFKEWTETELIKRHNRYI